MSTISKPPLPFLQAPGPGFITLLRSLPGLRANPLNFIQEMAERYGDIVQIRLGRVNVFLLNSPGSIQHILVDNNRNYNKDTVQYNALAEITGKGLLTNDGEFWLQQRRRMQPAFRYQRINSFGPLMVETTVNMLRGWKSYAESGQYLDVDKEMMRLAVEILGKALLGIDLSREAPTLTTAVMSALDHIVNQLKSPTILPGFIPTRAKRRFRESMRTLDQAVMEIIESHRQTARPARDLLSLLIREENEPGETGIDGDQLRDEIITILIAGHETVASALTWPCYLLAQHPEMAERLRRELDQILNGRLPRVEDLPALEFTRHVFEESLRLYPPAWLITRKCLLDDVIDGFRIPAGSLMVIGVSTIQRHPAYWHDPESFNPDRFTAELATGRPRYSYLPFGGGPRLCIGSSFALTEATLVLACIFRRYRLELPAGFRAEAEPLVTLRPRSGMPVLIWNA